MASRAYCEKFCTCSPALVSKTHISPNRRSMAKVAVDLGKGRALGETYSPAEVAIPLPLSMFATALTKML